MNLLIVGPSWLGDAVMMGSLVQRLKARDPAPTITVMAPPHLLGLLARMPGVDDTVANPFEHGALRLGERLGFGRGLRRRGFEAAIILPNSLKSALVPFFAGIPRRIGFVGEGRYVLLSDARQLDEAKLPRLVDRYGLLADEAGAEVTPAPAPRLEVDAAASRAVMERLGLDPTKPSIALCVGAEYGPAKRWPAAHFAELARRLAGAGLDAWLLGSPADAPIGAEITTLVPGVARDLTGRTSLEDAVDLLAAARAVVTNDTGLMHVAAAVDRPLVALYGSSSPAYTPPLATDPVVLSLGLSCSPCFERRCPLGHFKCLNELSPDRVWAALLPMLGTGANALQQP
jgi:heptosyltransferase-2